MIWAPSSSIIIAPRCRSTSSPTHAGEAAKRQIELIAYQYTPKEYERIQPDAQGRIWLEAVQLWIGVTRDVRTGFMRLACYDPETGEEFGDYTALNEASERAQAEALAANQQARKAKRQLSVQAKRAETEAKRTRPRPNAPRPRPERAETEAKRAETEAKARVQAEARIRELEAQLKRSRGQG